MDEDEFRSTYHAVNPRRCVFEKAINSRVCNCSKSQRFNLADREGVSCTSESAQSLCAMYLEQVRMRARFALKISNVEEALPHGIEIKLQNGGALGLQKSVNQSVEDEQKVADISALLEKAGSVEELPYEEIVSSVAGFQARKRRQSDHCK